MQSALDAHSIPAAVLDTNVVLDWLLFGDPALAGLSTAIQSGHLRWMTCARMRDEFARVLDYEALQAYQPDSVRLLTMFDAWAQVRPAPVPMPTHPACTDPDDQIFVDLALAVGARWLVTRDRALLKLARRTLPSGLLIVTPTRWAPA